MLAIILLSATVSLPLITIYFYQRYVRRSTYIFERNDILVPLGAALVQFLASTVPYAVFESRVFANFLHHAIGGGVVVAIMMIYVLSRVMLKASCWIKFAWVMIVANVLGNANEVLELGAELLLDMHTVASRLDTNIDIVANNTGALLGFILILAGQHIAKRFRKK